MAEEDQNLDPNSHEDEDSLENFPNQTSFSQPTAVGSSSDDSATNKQTSKEEGEVHITTETADGEGLASLKPNLLHRILGRFNPYIFLLVILVMIAISIILVAFFGSQGTNTTKLVTQNLSAATLKDLASSDTNVGSSNEVLNVESSAIFSGNILARESLQVAGNMTVGGTIATDNLSIDGTGQFGQLNVSKDLSVSGDSNVQGNSTITKDLQVNGSANFESNISTPQITTNSLQLNNDLVITHHIDTGGSIPSAKGAGSLGSGGTVSISGSDTSGSVNVNTGSNTTSGCFITINFTTAFNKTPYIEITPVGASAGGLEYYITRSSNNFSICDASAPPANVSFGFDYFATD